jgi:preprotein translocase subunit SecY
VNTGRFATASIAAFVVIAVVEFIIHGVLLTGIYQQAASVFRQEAEFRRLFWLFYVGYLVFAVFFTFIYTRATRRAAEAWAKGCASGSTSAS